MYYYSNSVGKLKKKMRKDDYQRLLSSKAYNTDG